MTAQQENQVQIMETALERFQPRLEALQEAVQAFQEHHEDYQALRDFYGSEVWLKLHDNAGPGEACGVLSQDRLYDLIEDHNRLLGDLLELVSVMYSHS
ncbi:DUF4298 domain-containing protein [Streptococcus danieliae]|uniref:DUF4298 domain-containing protein n=1 Tax=Streptococcus danieliae TaxID=747656 RepID=A0A7Z0RQH4_9STRE|nr:DUF4298 domain-containing protein [Streptococcus danieliae]MBF0716737.1 DUF4298 domain-containing protein [Streptococcus danieliae]NYS48667.1 DUF4298 domain-containing protein [Streptococcus danieliae]